MIEKIVEKCTFLRVVLETKYKGVSQKAWCENKKIGSLVSQSDPHSQDPPSNGPLPPGPLPPPPMGPSPLGPSPPFPPPAPPPIQWLSVQSLWAPPVDRLVLTCRRLIQSNLIQVSIKPRHQIAISSLNK